VYGEASAPRRWADTLTGYLIEQGFVQGKNDKSLFFRQAGSVSLVVHTDDIFFDGEGPAVDEFLADLGKRFDINDPEFLSKGNPVDFLGSLLIEDDDGVYMSLQSYVECAIEVMNFENLKDQQVPITGSIEGGVPLGAKDTQRFATGVGALGWINTGRCDVTLAFSRLAQHLQNPTTAALAALRKAYGYLQAYPDLCLFQPHDAEPVWKFYTDSDYAGNTAAVNKLRPQLGILATCGGTPRSEERRVGKEWRLRWSP